MSTRCPEKIPHHLKSSCYPTRKNRQQNVGQENGAREEDYSDYFFRFVCHTRGSVDRLEQSENAP